MDGVFTIHIPKTTGNVATFSYSYTNGAHSFTFQEEHTFPFEIEDSRALRALAIATSISYFKLHLAPQIQVDWTLPETENDFWEWLFRNGFSELVYQNKLDWNVVDRIKVTCNEGIAPRQESRVFEKKAVVGIGGGKDSSLTVELLKKLNIPVLGFATKMRTIPLLSENAKALDIPLYEVHRKTDPQLLTLKENVYLGHIPVSLIYALTGVLIAEHEKSAYVVVGNETSADESNTTWLGRSVNHQWSKTSEFEQKLQNFVHQSITPEITYFSILRPLGGLRVTNLFAKMCSHTFSAFSSCNKNFTIENGGANRWCGTCAKCLGTNMLLSGTLPLQKRVQIFSADLYQNQSLSPLLKELLGLSPIKPFDCVATRTEMCFAAAQDQDLKESPLGKTISEAEWTLVAQEAKNADELLTKYHDNFIPKEINGPLRAIIEA
ncbi:MAG: hypothetical protein WAV09_04725 [Minisyncoccia bacterium]